MQAVIYARRSKDDEDTTSIAAQERTCRQWAARSGYEVVATFNDDGYSGATTRLDERPGGRALLARLDEGGIDAVICWRSDRLGRDAGLMADVETVNEHGAGCRFTTRPYDPTMSRDRAAVLARQANRRDADKSGTEREDIRERMTKGRHDKAAVGVWAHGRPPFGYVYAAPEARRALAKAIEEDTVPAGMDPTARAGLAEHPTDAGTVRMIYDMAARGASLREIARALDDGNRPTPSESRFTGRKKAPRWTVTTLSNMLKSKTYRGEAVYGLHVMVTDEVTGTSSRAERTERDDYQVSIIPLTPLVPPEQWQAVQDMIAVRRWTRTDRNPDMMLAGMVKCHHCGKAYATDAGNKGGPAYRHKKNAGHCCNKYIRADRLEAAVWATVAAAVTDPVNLRASLQKQVERERRDSERTAADIRRLEAQALDAQAALGRLAEAIAAGTISAADAALASKEAKARKADAEAAIKRIEKAHTEPLDLDAWLAGVQAVVKIGPPPKRTAGTRKAGKGYTSQIVAGEPTADGVTVTVEGGQDPVKVAQALVEDMGGTGSRRQIMEALGVTVQIALEDPPSNTRFRQAWVTTRVTPAQRVVGSVERRPWPSSKTPGATLILTLPVAHASALT